MAALVRVGTDHPGRAGLDHERGDPEPGRAEPELADDGFAQLDADVVAGAEHRGESGHRRSVHVVVHHRLVERGDEPLLDLEALGGADVLEVDGAEAPGDAHHGLDERRRVGRVDEDRHGRQPSELPVEERLAFHDRHGGDRPDVSQPEHARPVGTDGDGTADHRVADGERRVGGDGRAHPSHAGRVHVADVLEAAHRIHDVDGELAPLVRVHGPVVERDDPHPIEGVEVRPHQLRLRFVANLDRDLPDRPITSDRHGDDVADEASRVGDGGAHLRQLTGDVGLVDPVDVIHPHGLGL